MNRSFQHRFQRSLRTNIFPANGARDEDIVIVDEDEPTVKGSEEGEVACIVSAVCTYAHHCDRCSQDQ